MKVHSRSAGRGKRASLGCASALVLGLAVSLVVSLVSLSLFALFPRHDNASASVLRAQPGSLSWDGQSVLRVLLVALDGKGNQKPSAMTVASFDPRTQSAGLLSIPPNLWVTIPGYGEGRLSDAYADGGPRLALLVSQSVTHLPIPYYAIMRLSDVGALVDAVGGITLPPPPPTARSTGGRHMDGSTIAGVLAGSDVGAMERQQAFILALGHQLLKPQTFFQIPALLNTVGGSIDTNLPYNQVQPLLHALHRVTPSHLHGAILSPANGTVSSYSDGTGPVWLPDQQHILSLAHRVLAAEPLRAPGGVEVLNGTGVPGQAGSLAGWLREANITVQGVGAAASFQQPATEVIITRPGDRRALRIGWAVATLLQVPLQVVKQPGRQSSVLVIIGHDFLDPSQK